MKAGNGSFEKKKPWTALPINLNSTKEKLSKHCTVLQLGNGKRTRFQVGNGKRARFLKDNWLNGCAAKDTAPAFGFLGAKSNGSNSIARKITGAQLTSHGQ
jgi:hypothetical protein